MKLEASPVGETTVKMNHIQAQLANLMLQLQDIKKAKEDHDDIITYFLFIISLASYSFSIYRVWIASR